jgi:hypothetical protein
MGVTRVGKMHNHKDRNGEPQKGVFDVSRSKFYNDFVLTDPAKPNIPNTNIPRLRPVHLGGKSVAIDDNDTARVVEALKDFHASKAEQRASTDKKKKNPPPWLGETAR